MNKTLLTSLSIVACTITSNALVTPSQTTTNGVTTTIDCFKFEILDANPLGSDIPNGGAFTVKGNLTGGTYLPDISGYSITSFVTNFNASGNTTASLNSGVLTFTGSVGLVTTADQLSAAEGLGENCRTLDFSFNQCTVVDEGSALFEQIKEVEAKGYKSYFGVIGDGTRSVSFSDAFKYNEKTKTYEYDTDSFKLNEKDRVSMYYFNERKQAVEFNTAEQTKTIFKDFTVCVECVPEPSSTSLLGLGALSLLIRRKR